MKKNGQKQLYIKKIAGVLIGLAFCLSVFILAANRYGNPVEWLAEEEVEQSEQCIVTSDKQWSYMDEGEVPGVGNVWTTNRYEVLSWKMGSGVFAGGNLADTEQVDVKLTGLNSDGESAATCFFRTEFDIENLEEVTALRGKICYKDAVLVYLNGTVIFAGNVPEGGYESNQQQGAAQNSEGIWETTFCVTDLSSLRENKNILAVEVHPQNSQERNTYFCFDEFSVVYEEIEETAPNIENVYLEQGANESEIGVNWMTQSSDFYEVQYIPVSEYEKGNKDFSSMAESTLMGRTFLEDHGYYVNRAMLERLKVDTEYYYRIVKVGSTEGSKLMTFKTAGISDFSFVFLGDPQIGAYGNDDEELWEQQLENSISLVGQPDFIFFAGDQIDGFGETADIYRDYQIFRSPEVFKQIPSAVVKGNHDQNEPANSIYDLQFAREGQSEQGDYYFTYPDTLLIGINSNDMDFESHRKFIEKVTQEIPRKWTIVVMHHSIFSEGEHSKDEDVVIMREFYSQMFEDYDVDLVLSGHDHQYTRTHIMRGEEIGQEASAEGVDKKEFGETLYITAGSSSGNKFYENGQGENVYTAYSFKEHQATVTKVQIRGKELQIFTYRLDTGEIVDSYTLYK